MLPKAVEPRKLLSVGCVLNEHRTELQINISCREAWVLYIQGQLKIGFFLVYPESDKTGPGVTFWGLLVCTENTEPSL